MAKRTLVGDRRSFLSAAGVVATVAAMPTIAATNPRAAWDQAMARRDRAEAIYWASYNSRDDLDDLSDAWAEAEGDLMRMPSPDRPALRWKLDKIFEHDSRDDSTPSYDRHYLAQMFTDIRRLLGDA
jgi:hypothetical protein